MWVSGIPCFRVPDDLDTGLSFTTCQEHQILTLRPQISLQGKPYMFLVERQLFFKLTRLDRYM